MDRDKDRFRPSVVGKVALSKQACRFELPVNLRELEKMTAAQYLCKHCIISSRRKLLFDRMYDRFKSTDRTGVMKVSDIAAALKEIFPVLLSPSELEDLLATLELQKNDTINVELFNALCAYVERILYTRFRTEDFQHAQANCMEDRLEGADFCGIKSKFCELNVNPQISKLLQKLNEYNR